MNEINKEELIKEIKHLISSTNEPIEFNEKYIDYFELDELLEIRDQLNNKKESNKTPSKDYLDDIFNSCS
jgi:hypothetical protein